ncbi:MAG: biopolymer transporter ExbD [Acidobacteria bacterium]|nr:MAG: biopolymer transporter ExbD [Acidobacteriota bacterium]
MSMSTGGGPGGISADINVTPMADIMLVLLIIFMITTPLLQEGIAVQKAKARNAAEAPDVESEDATTITVTRDRSIYVNADMVALENVTEKVQERVAVAPDLPLFVKSDVATPYGTVVDVINRARDAGVEKIGLMVDREREGRVQ